MAKMRCISKPGRARRFRPVPITASILDGILLGAGDACIGINPASDDPAVIGGLLRLLDDIITRLQIPTQSCVLSHVTTTLGLMDQNVPVDLVFQDRKSVV